MKSIVIILVAPLVLVAAAPLVLGAVIAALLPDAESHYLGAGSPAPGADGIPAPVLAVYQAAASVCPGLSWTTLAAIGTVESANDQSTLPGVHSGHNPAGAEGPMQLEPSTFRQYDLPVPPGGATPPTPYDPLDAAYAAARMLCADGAARRDGLSRAVYAYNHSAAYVNAVLQVADRLQDLAVGATSKGVPAMTVAGLGGAATFSPSAISSAATVAVEYAVAQIGTPYRWGGETPGVGFDCSGLVQAAWSAAGVPLPRVAQQQFDAGPLLPVGTPLQPGDLVFFGPAGGGVTHVGMVTNPAGQMVDAPHTGAFVRVEPFPLTVGAAWGGDIYLGASRPGAGKP